VVYDACVLYPFHLRDLLVRLAMSGLFQAKWTDTILDECFASLRSNRPDLDPERLDRTRQLMCTAVRDCLVTGHESLIEGLDLPDPDDRHVLAAAIRCDAQVIVTWNLANFPASALEPFDLEAQSPGRFQQVPGVLRGHGLAS
jgi:predicted nucleic acid-binding protein